MKLFRTLFAGKSRAHVGRPFQPRRPLAVEGLEDRRLMSHGDLVVVPDLLTGPGQVAAGVSVAVGDVNGDGRADIMTGAGPGAGPHVKVFDGQRGQLLRSFFAYDAAFQGGVTVAAGDVNSDGFADIVTGAATGAPQVKVFNGRNSQVLQSFFAFNASFVGGVNVAVGDYNGDHVPDLVAGSATGAQAQINVFDGRGGQLLQ